MAKKKELRFYAVDPFNDSEVSELVCAENGKEARQIAWDSSDWLQECASDDEGWIGIRVRWQKDAYTKGCEKGIVDYEADALRRSAGWWFEDIECPICKKTDRCTTYTIEKFSFVGCSSCEENFTEGKLKKEDIPKEAIPYKDLENEQM